MKEIIKLMEVVNDVKGNLNFLDKYQFMICMCMLYDEYHFANPTANAAEMAKTVAEQVSNVNAMLGEYE